MRTTAIAMVLGWAWLAASGAAFQELTAEEMADGLGDFVKKKSDDNALGLLELMATSFAAFQEDQQKKVVKAVERCLRARREEGENRLYVAALQALAHMGEPGEKATLKSFKNNNVKKRPEVLSAALRSLAEHKNPRNVKELSGHLVHSEPLVVAAAAESLGAYHEESEKVRKEIVEQLVKSYANFHSLAESRPREPIYRDRLNVVERPMKLALEKLTGQAFETAPEWQSWYNDNKKKKWAAAQS